MATSVGLDKVECRAGQDIETQFSSLTWAVGMRLLGRLSGALQGVYKWGPDQ